MIRSFGGLFLILLHFIIPIVAVAIIAGPMVLGKEINAYFYYLYMIHLLGAGYYFGEDR